VLNQAEHVERLWIELIPMIRPQKNQKSKIQIQYFFLLVFVSGRASSANWLSGKMDLDLADTAND
jgi:hypothetical protein